MDQNFLNLWKLNDGLVKLVIESEHDDYVKHLPADADAVSNIVEGWRNAPAFMSPAIYNAQGQALGTVCVAARVAIGNANDLDKAREKASRFAVPASAVITSYRDICVVFAFSKLAPFDDIYTRLCQKVNLLLTVNGAQYIEKPSDAERLIRVPGSQLLRNYVQSADDPRGLRLTHASASEPVTVEMNPTMPKYEFSDLVKTIGVVDVRRPAYSTGILKSVS